MRNLIYTYSKPHLFRPLYISILEDGKSVWKYPYFWQPAKQLSSYTNCPSNALKTNVELNSRPFHDSNLKLMKAAILSNVRWLTASSVRVPIERYYSNVKVKTNLANLGISRGPLTPPPKVFIKGMDTEKIPFLPKSPHPPPSMTIKQFEENAMVKNSFGRYRNDMTDWWTSFTSGLRLPLAEDFSIKKLISKAACPERIWGRNNKNTFRSRPLGQHRNILEIIDHNSKWISEPKVGLFKEIRLYQNEKVMKMKTADQSREYVTKWKEVGKAQANPTSPANKRQKSPVNVQPAATGASNRGKSAVGSLNATKQNDKPPKKHEENYIKANREQSLVSKRIISKTEVNKTPGSEDKTEKPVTEYQSSSSYSKVFENIFEKALRRTRKPQRESTLAAFNRRRNIASLTARARKEASSNSDKPHNEQKNKVYKSNSGNEFMKRTGRSQFDRLSPQSTSKSKARFSTTSKIHKETVTPVCKSSRPFWIDKSKISSNVECKEKPAEPLDRRQSFNDERYDMFKNRIITKSFYSTIDHCPEQHFRQPVTFSKRNDAAFQSPKKLETVSVRKKITASGNSSARSTISCYGTEVKSAPKEAEERPTMEEPRREIHTVTVAEGEPPLDKVFSEMMLLCKAKGEPGKCDTNKKVQKTKEACGGKCSKKFGRDKMNGYVCKIARWLNIGCGRRRRFKTGCPKGGPK